MDILLDEIVGEAAQKVMALLLVGGIYSALALMGACLMAGIVKSRR